MLSVIKSNKITMKIIYLIVMTILFSTFITGCFSKSDYNLNRTEEDTNNIQNEVENTENEDLTTSVIEEQPDEYLMISAISDTDLRDDFLNACSQIGMDVDEITDFKQVDDWAGGPRYSFLYLNMPLRLYCNMDSTVNSIKLGLDEDIYKQGFEPYQISDYIVDATTSTELQILAEDQIKDYLNFPSTADFSWLDLSFGRKKEVYSVSSTVSAQNAFGVEQDLPFKLMYKMTDNTTTLIYLEIDGNILINNTSSIETEERKEVQSTCDTDETSEAEVINLIDGQLGKYGKTVNIDGTDYIKYFVPEGKYTITNNGKWCKVFLTKDEYFTNSSGYTENEIIETFDFTEPNQTATVTVGSDQIIELTINANVTLTPID